MKVLVIGGNGFLGYYIAKLLQEKGKEVGILVRTGDDFMPVFKTRPAVHQADLMTVTVDDLKPILKGYDMAVFAAGADDRLTPKKPALEFFRLNNVETTRKVLQAGTEVGLKRLIVLGSYFVYFAREWPEMHLERHPYVQSRLEQEALANEPEAAKVEMVTLELPYIFGAMEGKLPLWKPLIKYICKAHTVYYPAGGTAMIAADDVAKAVFGALTVVQPQKSYVIGGANLDWVTFINKIAKVLGEKKKVVTLPKWLVKFAAWFVALSHSFQGRESGLRTVPFIDVQTANTYVDSKIAQQALNYQPSDLDAAISATVEKCLKED